MSSEGLEKCERELKVILEELQREISYQHPSNYGGKHQIVTLIQVTMFFLHTKTTEDEQCSN